MYILGLDISSSKVGIALLKDDKIIISEVIKFKSNLPLEERALQFENRMQNIEKHYVVYDVNVEQPAKMFKGGKTTAHTMATLQRFNGLCCYAVRKALGLRPTLINPRSARSKLGIKPPRGVRMYPAIIGTLICVLPKSTASSIFCVAKTPRPSISLSPTVTSSGKGL